MEEILSMEEVKRYINPKQIQEFSQKENNFGCFIAQNRRSYNNLHKSQTK